MVTVVSFGEDNQDNKYLRSAELCGGT